MKERPPDANAKIHQMAVAFALGQIGPPAASAVPHLFARVREARYPELRYNAAQAIDRIDPTFAARCVVDRRAWSKPGATPAAAHARLRCAARVRNDHGLEELLALYGCV